MVWDKPPWGGLTGLRHGHGRPNSCSVCMCAGTGGSGGDIPGDPRVSRPGCNPCGGWAVLSHPPGAFLTLFLARTDNHTHVPTRRGTQPHIHWQKRQDRECGGRHTEIAGGGSTAPVVHSEGTCFPLSVRSEARCSLCAMLLACIWCAK
jgi:hypothetical protein